MNATEKMLASVEQVRREAKKATDTFESRKKDIDRLSSRQIDYFSSSFNSQVIEIAKAIRKANDELFASFQAMVVWLDEQCRPLLSQNPSTRAVKEVMEMLRWLNSESEIETKVTGTLNGSAMGEIANVNYVPGLGSQMIQKYWESAYASMPGTAEEDRAWKQRQTESKRAEQEAKDREEERRRKNRQAFYDHEAKQAEERRQRNVENESATMKRRKKLTEARGMIGGSLYAFAWIKSDGSAGAVDQFPSYRNGTPGDVSRFSDMKAIVCSTEGIVGLRRDGTCRHTNAGKCWGHLHEVTGWSDIVELAAGSEHVVGLRGDGTCVAISVTPDTVIKRYHGQSNVYSWNNVCQIACGSDFTVGLRKDGTVLYTGDDVAKAAAGWKDIVLIGAGCNGVVGVDRSGKLLSAGRINTRGIQKAENVVQIEIANGCAYVLQADGIVRGGSVDRWGMMNDEDIVGRDILAIAAGDGLCMLTKQGRLARPKTSVSSYYSVNPPADVRLFTSYESHLKALKEQEEKRRQEEEERRRLEAQRAAYRAEGRCQHCGGELKRSFIFSKCLSCGKRKDY